MDQAPDGVAEIADVEDVLVEELLPRVQEFADRGMRFITCTALDAGERFEAYYHFGHGTEMRHLRMTFAKDAEAPSISGIYFAAFLAENEMSEMFGIKVTGLALDYRGRMLLSEEIPPAPMLKSNDAGAGGSE
jgi:NADH:ubiquinone oxidoreductase subunit C